MTRYFYKSPKHGTVRRKCTAAYVPPRFRAVVWATSRFLAMMARRQPFCARSSATALPIPRDPPKMAQTLPIFKIIHRLQINHELHAQYSKTITAILGNITAFTRLQQFVIVGYRISDLLLFLFIKKINIWTKLDTASTNES